MTSWPTVLNAGDVARLALYLLVSITYVAFWLALATFCSVILRRAVTSAFVAIALWLATTILLNPQQRAVGFLLPRQVDRAVPSPLALGQSLLIIWPQVVALVAATVLFFSSAYVLFLRQEVRA